MKDLDVIEAQLARVLDFFPRVEGRISALFAADTVLLAIAALNLEAGDLRYWYVSHPAVLMLVALGTSYIFLYRANFPQSEGGEGSLVYFAEVRKRTEAEYIADFEACDEDKYRSDLLGQVWRNSQILCDKYIAVKWSIILTAMSLVPFIVFLTATAIIHSRIPLFKS